MLLLIWTFSVTWILLDVYLCLSIFPHLILLIICGHVLVFSFMYSSLDDWIAVCICSVYSIDTIYLVYFCVIVI